jgi:hypothetical protein
MFSFFLPLVHCYILSHNQLLPISPSSLHLEKEREREREREKRDFWGIKSIASPSLLSHGGTRLDPDRDRATDRLALVAPPHSSNFRIKGVKCFACVDGQPPARHRYWEDTPRKVNRAIMGRALFPRNSVGPMKPRVGKWETALQMTQEVA